MSPPRKAVRASFSAAALYASISSGERLCACVLIPEAVDEIFGRKLIRRAGLIAQQIAHGVVVLAVGQPAQVGLRGARCPYPRPPLRDISAPAPARRPKAAPVWRSRPSAAASSGAAGLDALAARVRQSGWWACAIEARIRAVSGRPESTRDRPNASIRSGAASGSGKCRRVADATPSGLWQDRQAALSITWYRPDPNGPSCARNEHSSAPKMARRLINEPLRQSRGNYTKSRVRIAQPIPVSLNCRDARGAGDILASRKIGRRRYRYACGSAAGRWGAGPT